MYRIRRTPRFEENAVHLPDDILKKLEKTLLFLSADPRHKGLKTHKVQGVKGFYGGDVFEVYVDIKYRLTFEYGPGRTIVLRNVGNHDEALKNP